MRIFINQYDNGGRFSGLGSGLKYWSRMASDKSELTVIPREMGEHSKRVINHLVREQLTKANPFLVIGGDHSLTFDTAEAVCSKMGKITLVHFDAHHDNYPTSYLNNYSVFSHIQRLLPIEIVAVGHRQDGNAPPVLSKDIVGPTFISFDVDYFDPSIVESVRHPVACGESNLCNWETFIKSIDRLRGPIIGAEIVEWCPLDGVTENEIDLVNNVFNTFQNMDALSPAGRANQPQFLSNDNKSSEVSYSFDKSTFTRKAKILNTTLHQQAIDSLAGAEMFLTGSTYTLKYHFPKRVKSASAEDATFSADGKTLIYQVGFLELMKNPEILNLEVELEE